MLENGSKTWALGKWGKTKTETAKILEN